MRFIPFSHTLIDAFLPPLSMTPGDENNAQDFETTAST
jgi:hypothetical protein